MALVNERARNLIKYFEGLELAAYPDPGTGGDPWTIGYGHTSLAGPPAVKRGMRITREQADEIFAADVEKFAAGVAKRVRVPVSPNEMGALVSLAFNIGLGNFEKSTLLRKLNAGDRVGAALQFGKWVRAAGRVLPGLIRRRRAEQDLFESR